MNKAVNVGPALNKISIGHPGASLEFVNVKERRRVSIFADGDLQVPLPNPVVADAEGGLPQIFLTERATVRLRDWNGGSLMEVDVE
jgi:hypothetical protein